MTPLSPWLSAVQYLGLMLDSKLLYKHLHTVANKFTGVVCNIFLFLSRDSTLMQSSTNYSHWIQPLSGFPTTSNQVIRKKSIRVTGIYPTFHLRDTL
jgi:hypothetical protein